MREEIYQGVWGEEIRADTSRVGHVDNGLIAYPERLAVARKHWPEARRHDFEQSGRRRWIDRATGTTYRRDGGCGVLMTPTLEAIDAWFVEGGEIVLLIRDDRAEASTVVHGEFYGAEIVNGQIIKDGS
jgi:hypothetical protein